LIHFPGDIYYIPFLNKSLFLRILFQIAILSFKLWETNIINVYVPRIRKTWNSSGWNLFIMLHNKKSTGSKQTNITISLGIKTKSWTHRQICLALWQEHFYLLRCLACISSILHRTVPPHTSQGIKAKQGIHFMLASPEPNTVERKKNING
jgi:hypothetical protein